jgi:DNA polymerase elongation subunit (family B)
MYRNLSYSYKNQCMKLFTWDEGGKRIVAECTYKPYLYTETNGTEDAYSIFNTKLKKKSFSTQFDRLKYLKDTGKKRVFENLNIYQQFLVDSFHKDYESNDFLKHSLKIVYLDIEVYSPENSFPHPDQANFPINVITIYDSLDERYYTWGMKKYVPKNENVSYTHCSSEKQLLEKFLKHINKDHMDILSGWNSKFFDIPYLVNRIKKICSEDHVLKLSPTKKVYSRSAFDKFGKEAMIWIIDGVSCIDYLDAYRKFCLSPRENYKLDTIASIELGEQKIDYGGGNLSDLADENWDKFVEYNIQDVKLLVRLEETLKYLDLLRSLATIGLTTIESALGSISVITGAAAIRARHRNQKIPTFIRDDNKNNKNEGAFVKEPENGIHKHLTSFDANSLYPNTMITLNISPETKLGVITNYDKDDSKITLKDVNNNEHTISTSAFKKLVEKESIAISKAQVLFTQKKKGLFPEIIDIYYKQRVDVRKKLNKIKRAIAEMEDCGEKNELKSEAKLLDIKQMTYKIFLNSIYGAFGNRYFSLGDDDLARSITLTGQAIINQGSKILSSYVEKITGKKPKKDVIRYIDTDSLFFSFDDLIEHKNIKFSENNKITKEAYFIIDDVENHLNEEIKKWGESDLNSKDCRIVFKREKICDVGMLLKKKHYILHILDDEGVKCNKFKYTGVDVVKSTMPQKVKPFVKNIAETLLITMDHKKTNDALLKAYEEFQKLPIEEIATIVGIKNYEKYSTSCKDFQTIKGMPNHVKSAYYYNLLLEKNELSKKYEKIQSGDKIKVFYLKKPNRYGIDSIAFKYYYPKEFKEYFEPDYEKMFDKIIFSPVEKFFEAVDWVPQKPNEITTCDLFEFFAEST